MEKLNNSAVSCTSGKALATLNCIYCNPGTVYNKQFFQDQWEEERHYHLNTNTSKRQQVELGSLICLEEELRLAW
ncbi:hypothetical protein VP01_682g7 [Puccinia sorghi]|uniref:Uncharacterized protein n=1 Tax=Puccinia sorghi TaxID=27349 RepID=A0A0L6UFA8_9BASI|nr:hypothetical protein VP01_682g7 [Puccinia sorghi]